MRGLVKYQREKFVDCIDELRPLLFKHWEEIARDKDIPLEIDEKTYYEMDFSGKLKIYTARNDENKLLGYCAFFINYNVHYKSSLQAVQDVIYIDKEHRGFGRDFIKWCDEQLKELGVQKVFHHVKVNKLNFGPMLQMLGYELADTLWAKRLDLHG